MRYGYRGRAKLRQPLLYAGASCIECFSIRRSKEPVKSIGAFEHARIFHVDFIVAHAIPGADRHFHQSRFVAAAQGHISRNARRCFLRAAQRADMNIDLTRMPLKLASKTPTRLIRLLLPSFSKWGILLPLKATCRIPDGLAMSKEKNRRQFFEPLGDDAVSANIARTGSTRDANKGRNRYGDHSQSR